jgi:predicted MFS family arabinose efflux permease
VVGVGLVLLAGFLVIEVRTHQPLLPLRLFADRNRAAGFLNFFLGPAAMMSMFFFLTQFLQDVRHFSALATGFAFLPLAAGMFVMTRLVPQLLPRFGPKPLALIGAATMVVGLGWLTQLHGDSGYATALLGPMLLMGLGGGLGFVPLTPVIMATVPPQDAGAAGGALQTMQQTGATLGLSILVNVFGTAMRSHHGPDALVYGMTTAFGVSVVIASFTFLVALTFRTATAASQE